MESFYDWISNFPSNIARLENLRLQIDHHIDPPHTENSYVKHILKWIGYLENLRNLELQLDFPNFLGLEKAVVNQQVLMSNLKNSNSEHPERSHILMTISQQKA